MTGSPFVPGSVLCGRYVLVEPAAAGGMCTVWRATDGPGGPAVAVKVPLPGQLDVEDFRERFEREGKRLRELVHPGVCRILDAGRLADHPFLVMAWLGGGSLAERRTRLGRGAPPRLPCADVARWLVPVAEALDFIHARGASHRDVKPENVLFDERERPHLVDFGLSKVRAGEKTLTSSGRLVGSPAYVPPEAVLGATGAATAPTYDQYSLATVVYEVLAGSLPFPSGSIMAVLLLKTKEDPFRVDAIEPTVPRKAADAVARALARDPEARFPSCAAFAREIAAVRSA